MSMRSFWRSFQTPSAWADPGQAKSVARRNILVALGLLVIWKLDGIVPQGISPHTYLTPAFALILLAVSLALLQRPQWATALSSLSHTLANIFVLSTIYSSLFHPPADAIYAVAFLSASTIYALLLQVVTFSTFQRGAILLCGVQYALICILVATHWFWNAGTSHPGTAMPRTILVLAPLISLISLSFLVRWRNDATRKELLAQQQKEKLMAMMSHEIRGQLQTTLSTGELLSTKVSDPVGKRALFRLTRVTMQLDRYLRDWVEFVRLDSPELSIESKPFNLVDLIDQTIEEHQAAFAEKGLVLTGPIWSTLDKLTLGRWQTAYGDPVRLKQVIHNLLDNALKYTLEGSVSVGVASPHQPSGWATVSVTDTGHGIPADQLKLVFEPFMRLSATGSSSIEGSGLGLAIASRLIQRMGGQLDATSQPNAGTCFTMSFPLKLRPNQKH